MLQARTALEVATLGGAAVLSRDDIGSLQPGKACDLAAYRIDTPAMSGAHDLVAALLLCGPLDADHVIVHGDSVLDEGVPVGVDVGSLVERHRRLAVDLVG
jgi:cytosine/adenosine deaminase-related metal-dependent hydrolase